MTIITSSPLPAINSPRIKELRLSEIPNCLNAYHMILGAEGRAVERNAEQDIISARVFGHLLLDFHAPPRIFGDKPCATLVKWIISPTQNPDRSQDDVVFISGKLLCDKLLRLFRKSTALYAAPYSPPSCPSFEMQEEMTKYLMEASSKDYRTLRMKVLARDGYRCMITGLFDEESYKRCAELRTIARRDNVYKVVVQTSQILKESTMQGIDPAGTDEEGPMVNKTYHAAGAMTVLENLGLSDLTDAFKKAGGVHSIWNLLSLESNLHFKFNDLDLWFEQTDQEHRYNVCVLDELDEVYIHRNFSSAKNPVLGAPMVVDFTSNLETVPPPNPKLLALHAACARVAHMSGATEFFDKIHRDAEEMEVLASDGSSAPLLDILISPFAVIHGLA